VSDSTGQRGRTIFTGNIEADTPEGVLAWTARVKAETDGRPKLSTESKFMLELAKAIHILAVDIIASKSRG
jgi:hypothetical protein